MKKLLFVFVIVFLHRGFTQDSIKEEKVYPCVILGGGIGAMTSSLYLSRAQILPLVIEGKMPGGIITQSHLVENWPGELGISGNALAKKLKKQAIANGSVFLAQEVISIDSSSYPYKIITKNTEGDKTHVYKTYSVIIAMGTTPKYLGVPGENTYWGKGVSNCATCDGSLYKGKTVAVVGGGDAAIVEADYLSNIASQVNIYIRKSYFKASDIALKEAVLKKKNVQVFFQTTVEEVIGNSKGLTNIVVKTHDKKRKVPIDGLFLAIGSTPNTQLLKGVVDLDKNDYVILIDDQKTAQKGFFAIGDIADTKGYKQAITAAGDGAKAAMQTEKYLRSLQLEDQTITYFKPKENTLPRGKKRKKRNFFAKGKKIVEVFSQKQVDKLMSSSLPVIMDFYADWCGPCKRIAPEIEKMAKKLEGKVQIVKVNADRFHQLFTAHNVRSMPTVLVFLQGKEITRKIGPSQIISFLKKLDSAKEEGKNFSLVIEEE